MLSLEQLRTFEVCAELGSFSAAARRLGKAQSAVSQMIANLEINLGQTLFDRSTRKPTLTEQGQQLLAHSKAVLVQTQKLESAARVLAEGEESELTLVLDPALLLADLFGILEQFSHQFSATSLNLEIANSNEIPAIIRGNHKAIGLMLIDGCLPAGVDVVFIGSLPFYTVAGVNHPLSQLTTVTHKDFLFYRQLLVRGTDNTDSAVLLELSPEKYWSNDFEAVKKMAEAGLGWCYLPAHMVKSSIDRGELCRLSVAFDLKTWKLPVDLVTHVHAAKGPALTWLENKIKTLLPD